MQYVQMSHTSKLLQISTIKEFSGQSELEQTCATELQDIVLISIRVMK